MVRLLCAADSEEVRSSKGEFHECGEVPVMLEIFMRDFGPDFSQSVLQPCVAWFFPLSSLICCLLDLGVLG